MKDVQCAKSICICKPFCQHFQHVLTGSLNHLSFFYSLVFLQDSSRSPHFLFFSIPLFPSSILCIHFPQKSIITAFSHSGQLALRLNAEVSTKATNNSYHIENQIKTKSDAFHNGLNSTMSCLASSCLTKHPIYCSSLSFPKEIVSIFSLNYLTCP